MAEDEKSGSYGSWSYVPTWDGSPQTWRHFKREMQWWLSSLDLTSTTKYNLAARWLIRQSGVVRQRGEEFLPDELSHQPEVTAIDPQSGESVVITAADPLAGINRLMQALEEMTGRSALDKRGELRGQFYNELHRRAGERISEFCTRFRVLVSELRAEGVALPNGELGWFLKEKLGLDPLRKQLLKGKRPMKSLNVKFYGCSKTYIRLTQCSDALVIMALTSPLVVSASLQHPHLLP